MRYGGAGREDNGRRDVGEDRSRIWCSRSHPLRQNNCYQNLVGCDVAIYPRTFAIRAICSSSCRSTTNVHSNAIPLPPVILRWCQWHNSKRTFFGAYFLLLWQPMSGTQNAKKAIFLQLMPSDFKGHPRILFSAQQSSNLTNHIKVAGRNHVSLFPSWADTS